MVAVVKSAGQHDCQDPLALITMHQWHSAATFIYAKFQAWQLDASPRGVGPQEGLIVERHP